MVAFSRLPDACQLALIKQLPPEDQLRARRVCRKWNTLVPLAASTRRSLVIAIGDTYSQDLIDTRLQPPTIINKPGMRLLKKEDGSPMFPRVRTTAWNCLKIVHPLPEHNGHLIASTFPGVSTLKVILDDENPKHIEMITILLQLWRQQLTSFHLIDGLTLLFPLPATITRPLFAAINSLSSLKRLVLNLILLPLGDLPVIAHLEELDIRCSGLHRHIELVTNLQTYGQSNRNLIQVGYTNSHTFRYNLACILEGLTLLSGHLRQAFTRLEVMTPYKLISQQDLPIVCNHFQSLTTLKVHYTIDDNGLVPLFDELSKLKHLIYLWLQISILELSIPNGHRPLPQLPSVKALILEPYLHTPQHMSALDIGWLFPNLQVIDFKLFQRNNFLGCGFSNVNRFPDANLELAKECLRQVFRPLKRRFGDKLIILHNLRDPPLGQGYDIGSAEELLATM